MRGSEAQTASSAAIGNILAIACPWGASLAVHIHSFIHSDTPTRKKHQGQDINTSHTSHSLHSHAHGVRCIPRSQTQFRVATPRVNPGSRLNPCNHLTWLACGRWRTQSFTTHTNSPTRKGHTKIPPRTRDTRFILIHVLIHVRAFARLPSRQDAFDGVICVARFRPVAPYPFVIRVGQTPKIKAPTLCGVGCDRQCRVGSAGRPAAPRARRRAP